jgi:hypothetical protein
MEGLLARNNISPRSSCLSFVAWSWELAAFHGQPTSLWSMFSVLTIRVLYCIATTMVGAAA